jgi:dGTPase
MAAYGGFDHNEQAFRILTSLERRYAEFDGLNLTWETLEGVVKHNGPLAGPSAKKPAPASIAAWPQDLELEGWPALEAQVAALADDIAYNNHDIDDGLRAGLFTIADLADVPLVGPVFRQVSARYPNLEAPRLIHEAIRRLIDAMVNDLLTETRRRLEDLRPRDADAIRRCGRSTAAFSDGMRENDRALKRFLFERMYRHSTVNRMTAKARRVVRDLFTFYIEQPDCLPGEWREEAERAATPAESARLIADYIAGMTDRYALEEHQRLFDVYSRQL